MNALTYTTDILVIGAGPAGLSAAQQALASGCEVDIVDDNFQSGGQIWRGGVQTQTDARAQELALMLSQAPRLRCHFQSKVIHLAKQDQLYYATLDRTQTPDASVTQIVAKRIIIATGARELLLPFPGWTLPGVTGAGGLQALAKAGYPVKGKRIIVAGTGPLLLAVAASLQDRGAIVTHILEQTSMASLRRFAIGLLATPNKILQALQLAWQLKGIKYRSNSFILEAHGDQGLRHVTACIDGEVKQLECELLACAYGLVPNLEIAAGLQCEINHHPGAQAPAIRVNQIQETTIAGVFCAGETTGVGGVDLSIAEGTIAGYCAAQSIQGRSIVSDQLSSADQPEPVRRAFIARQRWSQFAQLLQRHFELRPEIKQLCRADTIICRCEDVTYGDLQEFEDWRSAKLHTRCGMGACQGRICGNINRVLFQWERDVGRLPLQATSIHNILGTACQQATEKSEKIDGR